MTVYSEDDARLAPGGHFPLVGTDVELVGYRQGDDLMLIVNKGASGCIYRERLPATGRGLWYLQGLFG